jgi:hypothetical protein
MPGCSRACPLLCVLGPSPTSVSQEIHGYLQRHNENYLRETQAGKIAPPVVRVLRQGTYGEFRDWKVHVTGMGAGQIKVPPVVWDEELRNWLGVRVIGEF